MKIEIEDAVIAKNFVKPKERAILEDVLHTITDEQYSAIANKYDVTSLRIEQIFTRFVERCTTTNVNLIEQSNLEDRLYPFRKIEKMDHMDLLVQKIQEYLKNEKIENNFCADEIVNCKESEE